MATQDEINDGAKKICERFCNSTQPLFIGRNGSTEIAVFFFWINNRSSGWPWPAELIQRLRTNFGVWPITTESVDKWCRNYEIALSKVNGIVAGWYKPYIDMELKFINQTVPTAFKIPLRSLEPYYVAPELRWTANLANQDVAVVTSFTQSIQQQLDRIDPLKIWSNIDSPETILPPTTRWHLIKSYFPPNVSEEHETGWSSIGIDSWEPAVDYIVNEVVKTSATVAIIGCGALGFVVGGQLRKRGISVILLGGAVQVLFGIRGKRWENHDIISKFWNDYWIYPLESERPPNAATIEGACYWE
jgi:hypothetical protein